MKNGIKFQSSNNEKKIIFYLISFLMSPNFPTVTLVGRLDKI